MKYLSQIFKALVLRQLSFEIDLVPFSYQHVSYSKIINWLKTESSVRIKPDKNWGYPTIIQVEPTNRCNLKCPACPSTHDLKRSRGFMDYGIFTQLVDDLDSHLLAMLLWDWGEPFLHPRVYEMIRFTVAKGIKVMASTNGHLFIDKHHAESVVDTGLDVLIFSIDGTTQQTYERFRKSGQLDIVLQGMKNVLEARKQKDKHNPLINLRFIVNKYNEHEIPEVKALAESFGVDALTLRKFHSISERGSEFNAEYDLIPSQRQYQLPIRDDKNRLIPVRSNPCKNLWNCPTIHWDGTVCSCFMDYDELRPLGNLQHDSIMNIWGGSKYNSLRNRFRKNWQNVPICGQCSNGFVGGNVGRDANTRIYQNTP